MIKILGLSININDFLAQVGHALTAVFGLFVASSSALPSNVVTDVTNTVNNGILAYNDIATMIHSAGWVGVALAIYNWLQHNAVVTAPVVAPPVVKPPTA